MDAKTLEALKASIRKWRRNARVRKPENFLDAPEDCALCGLFYDGECLGCPVREKTGRMVCAHTPYEQASVAAHYWLEDQTRERMEHAHKAALNEVAFLESLLPEGETA